MAVVVEAAAAVTAALSAPLYPSRYLKFKLHTITLKAVFRECRALDLKNVIDLTFKVTVHL